MRHLFDSEKSKKSIRLVKQLQDLEEKAFEIEQRKKKQQELDDEAMARALQAQIESESSSTSSPAATTAATTAATYTSPITNTSTVNHSPPSRSSNGPPPLPVKPQAYNHSDVNSPTPRPLTPLYSAPSLPPRENKAKNYLPPYKSGVNVSIASPQVTAARPETPVISAAPNGFMNMPKPNFPQRTETPVQHTVPEPVAQYNSSSSYPTYPPSNVAATPKPAPSNTNAFYSYSGTNVNSANKQHQNSRPTESAPSIVFDQQYPAMQPISAPNYNTAASHSAPSLSHDKPLNEQHRPVMSTTPVSFDSRYNQEPKNHGGVIEPFHIVNNNASHPPPRGANQHQQQYYPNNSSTPLLEGYPTSRPKRSSFVEPSITPQQTYQHQNVTSATLLEGYQTPRPKRTSFVESSVTQRPPMGIYQNASTTHLSSTTSFQNVVSSIPANPQSSLNKSSLAQKPLATDKTATTYENASTSSLKNNNNNNNTSTPTSHVKSASQSSIPPKPTRPLPSTQPLASTASLPVETKARPVSQKSTFSDSVLSLKPDESDMQHVQKDEDENEWDVVSHDKSKSESDTESEYDYSDMIYDRRNEPTSDPFADSFAVSSGRTPRATPPGSPKTSSTFIEEELLPVAPKTPIVPKAPAMPKTPPTSKAKTIIIEPNMMSALRKDKVLDGEVEERRHVEKESQEIEVSPKINHAYQTPKMDPVVYQTPAPIYQAPAPIYQTPQIDPAVYQTPHIDPAVYQTPHMNQGYPPTNDEIQQFFPTNILKAGAPPVNPYASEVSADDYGYYQEDSKNKNLPKLPEKSNKEDRHITVSSVNPGQRVWIRVHPMDTGKELAERIHIVASYKTQRVIKITTASGRSVPLDNSPVFEDWNEIVAFKEGEAWKVDWGMMNPSYIDIISEGKEFMKQLKANFKSSS